MASLNLQPPKRRSLTNLHLSSCKELFLLVFVFFIPKLELYLSVVPQLWFMSSFCWNMSSIKMLLVSVQ